MNKFLFRFGFASPPIWEARERHGWDGEDSEALYILADNADDALSWGCEVAERYVKYLFEKWGKGNSPSWKEESYAHWIEENPAEQFSPELLEKFPLVTVGQFPDFKCWE